MMNVMKIFTVREINLVVVLVVVVVVVAVLYGPHLLKQEALYKSNRLYNKILPRSQHVCCVTTSDASRQ